MHHILLLMSFSHSIGCCLQLLLFISELERCHVHIQAYIKNFSDKDGKVWQGGGGRNPPPEASHLVITTPEIELLRPKSPMKNQQQMQQQQSAASLSVATSTNRRPTANSPQNPTGLDVSNPNPMALPAWGGSQMEGFKGRGEANNIPLGDKVFDIYALGGEQPSGEYVDFESHRQINML